MTAPGAPSSLLARLAALGPAAAPGARDAAILAALDDPSLQLREEAIALAARFLEPQVLGALVADGGNAVLRNAALMALERQGPYAVPHLLEMLKVTDADVVMFAAQVLARINDPASSRAIIGLLRHSDPNVAQAAAESLGALKATAAVPALLEMLGGELWLQMAAIQALGQIGHADAVAPLLALVPDSFVAAPAIQALSLIAAPASLDPLLDRLRGADNLALRDDLLAAVAAVIAHHPAPDSSLLRLGAEIDADRSDGGLHTYLGQLFADPTAAALRVPHGGGIGAQDDRASPRGGGPLLRAAGTLVLAARVQSLYRALLGLSGDRDIASWLDPLARRHRQTLSPVLRELLTDAQPAVRRAALVAGAFDAGLTSLVLARLDDDDPEVRAAAIRLLGSLREAPAVGRLVEKLRQGSEAERAAAAEALGRMPGASLHPLRSCLDSREHLDVVLAALAILEKARSTLFESELIRLLHAPAARIRRGALRALANHPSVEAEEALILALTGEEEALQYDAMEILVQRDSALALPPMLAILQDGGPMRYHVIRTLGRLESRAAAEPLEHLYAGSPLYEKIEIVSALVRIAPPGIIGFLRARLEEPEVEIRRVAIHGLARMAGPAELPLLVKLAQDPDWTIRNEVAVGLGLLASTDGRPALLELSRDLEPVVARTARNAIAALPGGGLA